MPAFGFGIAALARKNQPEAKTGAGPHAASVSAWVKNCEPNRLGLEMYREGQCWRVQTVPKNSDGLRRELGESVAMALGQENQGIEWGRTDAIITRGLEATGTGAFMDYLQAIGEIELVEGK